MAKKIVKEIIIILLISFIIFLIQGIVFYDYIPKSKNSLKPVEAYELPEDISEELSKSMDTQNTRSIVKTYSVTSKDLKGFERSNDYNKGKINPFSTIQDSSGNSGSFSTNGSTNSSGNSNLNSSSEGRFLNTVK